MSKKEAEKMGIFEAIMEMKPYIGENPYFKYDKNILIELDYDQAMKLKLINPSLPDLREKEECQMIHLSASEDKINE